MIFIVNCFIPYCNFGFKAWAAEHPDKVVERKADGRVMLVTNIYTQGDICEENGAHRFFILCLLDF